MTDNSITENFYADGTIADEKLSLLPSGLARWMPTEGLRTADLSNRCTVDALQAAVSHVEGLTVVAAEVNESGQFSPPQPHWIPPQVPVPEVIGDLPAFCDIRLHQRTPGGHVAHIRVWAPLAWNNRFLATGGMGSLTGPLWFEMPTVRSITMPIALRNGFVTGATDGGNRDTRFFDWPLDRETGVLDWELLRNWSHRATHDMRGGQGCHCSPVRTRT